MTDKLPPDLAAVAQLLQRAAVDEAPPAQVLARALALDGMLVRLKREGAALVRRLVALAVPEPGAHDFNPAWGVRGATDLSQQWLFRAEEFEIDLRACLKGESWALSGQLFGMPEARQVQLEGGDQTHVMALGPTFEFSFDALDTGFYRLIVRGSDCEIIVPNIQVGRAEGA